MLYALVNLTSPVGHSSNSLHLFSSSIPALENIVPSPPLPNSLEVFAQINASAGILVISALTISILLKILFLLSIILEVFPFIVYNVSSNSSHNSSILVYFLKSIFQSELISFIPYTIPASPPVHAAIVSVSLPKFIAPIIAWL